MNTLSKLADGTLLGDNTDGAGLVRDLTVNAGLTLQGKRILLLGAGGAVRGALEPLLAQQPSSLIIANRTVEKPSYWLSCSMTWARCLPVVSTGCVSRWT